MVFPDGNEENLVGDCDSHDCVVDSDDQSSGDDDAVLMEVGETSDDDDGNNESDSKEPPLRSFINKLQKWTVMHHISESSLLWRL